jgi:hypothetical protein
MKAMADVVPFARGTRGLLALALLAVPLIAIPAGAGSKTPAGPVSHHTLGETVVLAGCKVTVTHTELTNEPDPRLAVEATIAEVGAGKPGRCHLFYAQGDEGELQSPEVATSSMTVERDAPVSVASAFFLFEPSDLPAQVAFTPLGDEGPRALWVAP